VLGRTIGIVGYGRIGREVAEREEAEKESGLKIEGWH
jgi:phosphoglycerate dehydrogenase-like enzyme